MAKAKTKEEGTDVAVKEAPGLPAEMFEGMDMGEDEALDRADIAIPFIRILQTNSPAVNKRDDAYVEGAEAGHIINTATEAVYDGTVGIMVTPVAYKRAYVEWIPRSKGGGFVREWPMAEVTDILSKLTQNENGARVVIPGSGNELIETMYHTIYLWQEGREPTPAVIAMKSTELPIGRAWNTKIGEIQEVGAGKRPWMTYKITTVHKSNEKGDWFVMKIETVERTWDKFAREQGGIEGYYEALTKSNKKAVAFHQETMKPWYNSVVEFGRQSKETVDLSAMEGAVQAKADGTNADDAEQPY